VALLDLEDTVKTWPIEKEKLTFVLLLLESLSVFFFQKNKNDNLSIFHQFYVFSNLFHSYSVNLGEADFIPTTPTN